MAKKKKLIILISYILVLTMLLCYKNYSFVRPKIVNERLVANYLTIEEPKNNFVSHKEAYLAVLEIPRINLIRGFFRLDSPKNKVSQNITLIKSSTMPDVDLGNLILAAHRGNSNVSFFDKLPLLQKGDEINIYYNNYKYTYIYDDYYDVSKDGHVEIIRNNQKTAITLITCHAKNSKLQTIYIGYLKNKCYNNKKGVDYEK